MVAAVLATMKTTVFEVVRLLRSESGWGSNRIVARFDHYTDASAHVATLHQSAQTSHRIRHRQLIGKPEPLD